MDVCFHMILKDVWKIWVCVSNDFEGYLKIWVCVSKWKTPQNSISFLLNLTIFEGFGAVPGFEMTYPYKQIEQLQTHTSQHWNLFFTSTNSMWSNVLNPILKQNIPGTQFFPLFLKVGAPQNKA